MGWASGSTLMGEIISAVQSAVPDEAVRVTIYRPIYRVFRDDDWDTVDECLGDDPAFDAVVREIDPMWFDEDEEDDEDEDGEDGEDEAISDYLGDEQADGQ